MYAITEVRCAAVDREAAGELEATEIQPALAVGVENGVHLTVIEQVVGIVPTGVAEPVRTEAILEAVIALTAHQNVVALSAQQPIVASPSSDKVPAAGAIKQVIAREALVHLVEFARAEQDVVSFTSIEDARAHVVTGNQALATDAKHTLGIFGHRAAQFAGFNE